MEEEIIDEDRVAGPAKNIQWAVKQMTGKAVDDAKLEPDGKAGNIDHKVQSYLAILDLMPGRWEGREATFHMRESSCVTVCYSFLPRPSFAHVDFRGVSPNDAWPVAATLSFSLFGFLASRFPRADRLPSQSASE